LAGGEGGDAVAVAGLQRLPFHEPKIDKSFVTTMLANDDDLAIVSSTINLCRNLDPVVAADGTEDETAWGRLLRLQRREGPSLFTTAARRSTRAKRSLSAGLVQGGAGCESRLLAAGVSGKWHLSSRTRLSVTDYPLAE
jgi:predicted signal transduction protein with EAL and GGDEF domain